ncbi:MAG: phosphoribosyl-ATP diphosphatase [Clostridiales bacterium]|nr:phosphoribosyl-ATP diphosphatase [Clostridiales bacterium]
MSDILRDLYAIVENRRAEREEGSYTNYLFESGLDKILKKLGEEEAETLIAAKNLELNNEAIKEREELKNEVSDLLYHLVVMLNELGVRPEEIEEVLRARMQKKGNLKKSE